MTQLLVSVRSAEEANEALAGGADLIDVKEPNRGSLGRADPGVWQEVAVTITARAPLSVALGELRDLIGGKVSSSACPESVQFAKIGLAGCAAIGDWPARWAAALEQLPAHVNRVAVSYADWRAAEAPPPTEVIAAGKSLGCRAWLIDTYVKQAGGLLDHLGLDELADLVSRARAAGMRAVVAGSLTPETIPRVLPLWPDFIAVRGAACLGGREGHVDRRLVSKLVGMITSFPQAGR
jgi:(5-formylfuran-3-yl)methyl phosphate synthase